MGANEGEKVPEEDWAPESAKRLSVDEAPADSEGGEKTGWHVSMRRDIDVIQPIWQPQCTFTVTMTNVFILSV